jgi:hypothetical protein
VFRKSSDQLVGVLVLLVVLFHVTSALNLLYYHDFTGLLEAGVINVYSVVIRDISPLEW